MNYENLKSDDGYMTEPSQWSEEYAQWRMEDMGIIPTEMHWNIIQWMRNYMDEHSITPDQRTMLRKAGKQIGYSSKEFYELFPNGPKQAAMAAGGTKPSGG